MLKFMFRKTKLVNLPSFQVTTLLTYLISDIQKSQIIVMRFVIRGDYSKSTQ